MNDRTIYQILCIGLLSLIVAACQPSEKESPKQGPDPESAREEINLVLDDWHQAAAEGDFERYFSHFEDEESIFMGTDATERWTVAEFKPWSRPYFEDDGVAWTFEPVFRKVYLSGNGKTAWFDEELDTPNLGPSRGSGVLVYTPAGWKIAHYNLAIPIPNAIVDDVVDQINQELNKPSSK